jgi:hypothetical protein
MPAWLAVRDDYSNAPEQARKIIREKVEAASVIAEAHSIELYSFMGSILQKRWKEQYSLADKPRMTSVEKHDLEVILGEERAINEWLYSTIKVDSQLFDANVVYNDWVVTSERFFESEEKHTAWLSKRVGDQADSLMDYSYDETLRAASDAKRVDIRLSGDLLSVTVPVFFKGKYVCDLWFNYCVKGLSE